MVILNYIQHIAFDLGMTRNVKKMKMQNVNERRSGCGEV